MTSAVVAPRAGRREWIGLAILALPCMLYSMDLTVLYLAVPALIRDLAPSSTQLLWIVDIYGFVLAGALIPMGTLGDRIGRRRLLMLGAVTFGIMSVIAAFSISTIMLIAARAVLGLAAATLAPSTLSLIRHMFNDPGQRTFAISIWIMSFSVGAAIGPILGGILLESFWWGSVFLIAVPVMVLLLAIGPKLLPEYRDPSAHGMDWFGAALSTVAILAIVYGVKQIAVHGLDARAVVAVVAGLAVGYVFLRRQRNRRDALVDLKLFRVASFSAALTMNVLGFFVNFGVLMYIAQYLQLVLGQSPFQAGLWTLPSALGFIVGSVATSFIAKRLRPTRTVTVGLAVAALGFLVLSRVPGGGLPTLVLGSVIFSLGLAPVFTLAADIVVGSAPPENAGAASALSETSAELGGALGIATLGSMGTAVYRRLMSEVDLAGLTPTAAESARDTLGSAVSLAQTLGSRPAMELLATARNAFDQAFQVTAVVSAALAMGAAVMVALLLRSNSLEQTAAKESAP